MTAFHHGISAQEVASGILPMRNANVSVIGLVVTSTDADDDMYPLDTPVLLTGITQDNIDKSGTTGTLRSVLQTIRDIHNPTVVILRVTEPLNVDTLDVLLTCQSRFGLMPKRLGAPEIDTPDVVLKLVSIAKRRRGMVYASPRNIDGTLITDKAAIVTYRDGYGDRELCIIEGEWGVPGKPDGVAGEDGGAADKGILSFIKLPVKAGETSTSDSIKGLVYSLNDESLVASVKDVRAGDYVDHSYLTIFERDPRIISRLFWEGYSGAADWTPDDMPIGLDPDFVYIFGFDLEIIKEMSFEWGEALPDGIIEVETILTFYPATKIPSANIDYDAFSKIIDPDTYTDEEKNYFASRGIFPAIKNPDGSIMFKSQIIMPDQDAT